ncbi:serine hydrolase domain-containing protein [Qipengyuania flava]|uniref:serine hydrolase domain-containing protein n=1 Tax=Qipengyuania flava TaxID=192812 RepID=UPI001C626DFC|nr:serine hydrolase domain-containing protein [Qipengyuania flava]QYJ08266.1 beta-lactamase family protein [Qipengyuania flava]
MSVTWLRKAALAGGAAVLCASAFGNAQPVESSTQQSDDHPVPVSRYAEAGIEAAIAHDVPAFVMAFVSSAGVEEFVSHGVVDRQSGEPVVPTTQFQIASLSKIQTGIIVRNLVLEGKLDLDRPILDYLPDTRDARISENLGSGTVGHLVAHRSGLPRDTSVITREGNDPLLEPLTSDKLLKDLAIAEMVGTPGETYEYSNLGYALLGYIAERVSGMSFDALHATYVTDQYGMSRTMVHLDEAGEKALATPYRKEDAFRATQPWNTGTLVAASGIFSTPADLSSLMVAQLNAYRNEDTPELDLTDMAISVSEGRSYGFGLNRQEVTLNDVVTPLFYHSGDMDGYAGFYVFQPENDRGVVMLTTRGGEGADKLRSLAIDYVLHRAPRN